MRRPTKPVDPFVVSAIQREKRRRKEKEEWKKRTYRKFEARSCGNQDTKHKKTQLAYGSGMTDMASREQREKA